MFIAEACLLESVRNKIVTDLALDDKACNVEFDNMLPANAPKLYIAVSPGGISAGPRHRSSGGAIDIIIGVRVTVYNRVPEIARDKRRSTFLQLMTGIAPTLERVVRAIDNNYEVTNAAMEIIAETIAELDPDTPVQITDNETGSFPEPFRQFSPDVSARIITRDPYDAAQMAGPPADPIVAIARTISFSGARFMQVRSTWAP